MTYPVLIRRVLAALAAAAALAACGGGGSDGGGSSGASATPTPPASTTPAISRAEAFRFLNQASFGATDAEAQKVVSLGYAGWIDQQLNAAPSLQLPHVQAANAALPAGSNIATLQADRVDIWFRNALSGPDQLRQRVAFALSEIMVVSQVGALVNYPLALASFYDTLAQDAFGNFRTLMKDVTLHPAMGVYLSMLGNQKPDAARNIRPDENYARELMQLFTVGLVQLAPDGTTMLDGSGQPLPTFDQPAIEGFAHVYTGWTWAGGRTFAQARASLTSQVQPMQAYGEQHATTAKKVLTYTGAALTEIPAGQAPEKDLDDALDNIFQHPNVAPFIARALIQRLVTSNPSPAYVARIAAIFADDGTRQRGNLRAVVRALLLDPEARNAPTPESMAGKLKEPLLRITQLWRAYDAKAGNGGYAIGNITGVVGQGPLLSPSVFNFFSPFYAPPGEIAEQGLVAPEAQIATEYQNTQLTNFIYLQSFCSTTAPINGCAAVRAETVIIDTATERGLANDPAALVDRVAARLLGGEITSGLAAEAKAQVERAPATNAAQRAGEAIYLIASSPEFALQR